MPRPRKRIPWKTKYAAALLALGHVPYEHAKLMHEDQIISLYQIDHGMLHAFDGPDAFWNLTPKLVREHREKSKRDKSITAKADRINDAQRAHMQRQSAKLTGSIPEPRRQKRKIARHVDPWGKKFRAKLRRKA